MADQLTKDDLIRILEATKDWISTEAAPEPGGVYDQAATDMANLTSARRRLAQNIAGKVNDLLNQS